MRIFYASDIHGSDRCFRKFLGARKFYNADALVLGGDITGKAIVPLVVDGGEVRATFLGSEHVLAGEEEVQALEQRIADTGYYSHRCTPDEAAALRADPEALHALFVRKIVERVEQWMALADERLDTPCFVNAGNDDPPEIDPVIDAAARVEFLEGRVVRMPADIELAELRLRQPDAVGLPARRRGVRAGRAARPPWPARSRTRRGRCSTSTARPMTRRSTSGRVSTRTCACARPRAGSR